MVFYRLFPLFIMSRKLFVTTALPYANAPFHIGHIMEYIQADIWVRFQRMQEDEGKPREIHFVGADDVHGAPIMIAAEKAGKTPAPTPPFFLKEQRAVQTVFCCEAYLPQ